MIRQIKHNSKDYFVVYTNLVVKNGDESFDIPVNVQLNITNVDPKKRYLIYKQADRLFNYKFTVQKSSPKQNKPWYKFW